MKTFPLVALAAIALGALAWSCSDQMSTTPLELDAPALHHAPDHARGGGGGGNGGGDGGGDDGGSSTTVALAAAMTTVDPQAHPVGGRENKRSLQYNTDHKALPGGGAMDMDFSASAASADCWTEPAGIDRTELVAQLTATASGVTLEINFDKRADGVASGGHGATAHYDDFRVGLPPHREPVASIVDDGATATITYSGGVVRVWRISDDARLFCPNEGDVVTATLIR